MFEIDQGDLLRADVEALVNPVNCVGYMGKGLALQFRKAYPDNFQAYGAACARGEVVPGSVLVYDLGGLVNPRYIMNFPTKRHWREKSRLEDVVAGLNALVADVGQRGIRSVAVPPLGCGLGGLDWALVKPLIEQAFAAVPTVRVRLFEPLLGEQ